MDADQPTGGTSEAGHRTVTDHIDLSIPARAEFLSLVRLAAGVVAARADLGLDDVEDLRLGVEELCLVVVGPSGNAPGRLALRYRWDDDTIEITCSVVAGDGGDVHGEVSLHADTDRRAQRALRPDPRRPGRRARGVACGGVPRAWLTMRRNRSPAD